MHNLIELGPYGKNGEIQMVVETPRGSNHGARALRPTLRWGDIDGGDDSFSRLGQRGIWSKRCLLRQFGVIPAGGQKQCHRSREESFGCHIHKNLAHRSLLSTAGPRQIPSLPGSARSSGCGVA